jgi:hypothetical protein
MTTTKKTAVSTLPVIVACALLSATEARAATRTADPSNCEPDVVTMQKVGPIPGQPAGTINVIATARWVCSGSAGSANHAGPPKKYPVKMARLVPPLRDLRQPRHNTRHLYLDVGPRAGSKFQHRRRSTSRRTAAVRHRHRRPRSARLAQEAQSTRSGGLTISAPMSSRLRESAEVR